jgi:SGNH domain (fused to AT3 domains)
VGLVTHVYRGFPGRYAVDPEPVGLASYGIDVCHMWRKAAAAWNEAACTFPAAHPNAPRVILWGDSFAAHYFPGLLALQKTLPFTLVHASMSSCAPVPHADASGASECEAFNRRIYGLIRREKPQTVVWAGRWDGGMSMRDRRAAETILAQLKRDGIPVIVTGESPVYDAPVPQRHAMNALRGNRDTRYAPANSFRTEAVLERLARDNGAEFFSPRAQLCRDGRCVISQGQLLYWDEAHFSVRGSMLMANAMAPLLKANF